MDFEVSFPLHRLEIEEEEEKKKKNFRPD